MNSLRFERFEEKMIFLGQTILVCAFFGIVWMYCEDKKLHEINTQGMYCKGIITDVQSGRNGKFVKFKYCVNGKEYKNTRSEKEMFPYAVGDTIMVHYIPDNPSASIPYRYSGYEEYHKYVENDSSIDFTKPK